MMMAEFYPIQRETWDRAQIFYYYTELAPTTYSMTVNMDVTILRKTLKERGIKFFPAYLYLVTTAIKKQKELRVALKDDTLGYWEYLNPLYPQFHEDDTSTTLLWTEYSEDFHTFYKQYLEDTKKYGDDHGIISTKGIPQPNSYVISCIPWITFNDFSLHNHGIKGYFFPSFEAGKFFESQDKLLMPLSITVHHATVDGYHLKVFLETLQQWMDAPTEWL